MTYRSGVGILLLNSDGLAFMAKRIQPKNAWQLPQGGIESNEAPQAALLRELKEEIGTNHIKIIAQTKPLIYDFPEKVRCNLFGGKYKGQKQIWFAAKFLGNNNSINLNYSSTPEFCEWKWEAIESLVKIIVEFKKDLYKSMLQQMHQLKVINYQ